MISRGFSLIELLIVVVIISIIVIIAIPSLIESKKSAETVAALATVRHIAAAEAVFYAVNRARYADLKELAQKNYIDDRFISGTASYDGYVFTNEFNTIHFTIWAKPDANDGRPDYYINDTMTLHYGNGVLIPAN